ncbi:plasma membrane calcium, partial [Coemansia sp. RSA 2603]
MDNSGSTPAPEYTSQQSTPPLLRDGSDPSEKALQQQVVSIDVNEPSSEQLSVMVADKDITALQKIGGTNALLNALNVEIDAGLVPEDRNVDGIAAAAANLDASHHELSKKIDLAKELAAQQDSAEVTWLAEFETDCKLYADRVEKYGVNILPPAKSRSFLGLVWDALHDKMLILLIVAAIVSLGIGIYQDVRVTGDTVEDSQNVHWVEGFAIIVAIAVVTLVASINDYQKEKQFRRLNAKKNDRKVRLTRGGQERLVSTN